MNKHIYYFVITTEDLKEMHRSQVDAPFGIPSCECDVKCSQEKLIDYLSQLGITVKEIEGIKTGQIASKLSNATHNDDCKNTFYVYHCIVDEIQDGYRCNTNNVEDEMNPKRAGDRRINDITLGLLACINVTIHDSTAVSLVKALKDVQERGEHSNV